MSHGSVLSSTSSSSGGVGSTGKLQQFVCIEYPGMVKSVDNMLTTLGGVEKISQVSGAFLATV